MFEDTVRARLTYERRSAGYSQRQLAKETGLRQSLIAKIESGDRRPDIETVGTLARFYEVSTDYLFGFSQK